MADDTSSATIFGVAVGGEAARVVETGIALLHKDEVVLPAPGAEALAELAVSDERMVINYYFPVEIEIRGGPEATDAGDSHKEALVALTEGLQNLA